MTPQEFDQLSLIDKAVMEEIRKIRYALEAIAKAVEKGVDLDKSL